MNGATDRSLVTEELVGFDGFLVATKNSSPILHKSLETKMNKDG
jgi:hypothetical protein